MRGARRPAAVLAAGAALLALAWGLGPRSAPPLYDGGPIIAEHYRYLHVPPGYSATKAPGKVDVTLQLEAGQSPPIAETTEEQPSQAQLLAAQQSFAIPAGTTAVHVVITAVDPPAVGPSEGALDGNVYRFAVTAVPGGAALTLRPGQQVTVVLRGPAGVTGAVLEVWDGTRWNRTESAPLGASSPDSYAANVTVLGDMALVAPPQSSPSSGGGGGGSTGIIVAAVIVAVAIVAGAVVLVLRRS